MENITFVEVESFGDTTTHVIIDRGKGEFTSMPKSTYDEIIAAEAARPHTPLGVNE
jgi:hypothetical protein